MILVLSPHTDDGEIGAGGTIAKLAERGKDIVCFAFWGDEILRQEFEKSSEILGIKESIMFEFPKREFLKHRQDILQLLYDYDKRHDIDMVFIPASTDIHQDHQVINGEALRAFKTSTILGYEIPRNNIAFVKTCFSRIEERHVKKKLEALGSYHTQKKLRSSIFNDEYFTSRMLYCGPFVGSKYAEAFEVLKVII